MNEWTKIQTEFPFNFYIIFFGVSGAKKKNAWLRRKFFDTVFINPDMQYMYLNFVERFGFVFPTL